MMIRHLPRGPRALAGASAFLASTAAVGTTFAKAERGPIFRDDGKQSLSAWDIVTDDDGSVYVQRATNPSERYRSPDGHNLVEGVPHPPFITQVSRSPTRAPVASLAPQHHATMRRRAGT